MWHLDTQARLSHWHDFRQKIAALPIEQAVHMTNELWSTAPISKRYCKNTWDVVYYNTKP